MSIFSTAMAGEGTLPWRKYDIAGDLGETEKIKTKAVAKRGFNKKNLGGAVIIALIFLIVGAAIMKHLDSRPAALGIPCGSAGDISATPANNPPENLPIVSGAHVYLSKGPFGDINIYFAALKANPLDLEGPRDRAVSTLEKAGYQLVSANSEKGSEAEAQLKGPAGDVSLQTIQLCKGTVRVKYLTTATSDAAAKSNSTTPAVENN